MSAKTRAACGTKSRSPEIFLHVAGRFPKARKPSCALQDVFPKPGNLPALCRAFSRSWKSSCALQDVFPELETFLRSAGRFPKARKPSCALQGVFPKLETFLRSAGRFPEAGNLPARCRTFSRFAAGRFRQEKKNADGNADVPAEVPVFSARPSAQVANEIGNRNSEPFLSLSPGFCQSAAGGVRLRSRWRKTRS